LIDEKIERLVEKMQDIIELGRYVRDNQKVSIKQVLRKVVIVEKNEVLHLEIM
jgi:hypothetical protein